MNTLVICHDTGSDPPIFRVQRLSDGKLGERAAVPPPVGFPVQDLPDSDLIRELRWYLERFLEYLHRLYAVDATPEALQRLLDVPPELQNPGGPPRAGLRRL